jgi:hypothetical protein
VTKNFSAQSQEVYIDGSSSDLRKVYLDEGYTPEKLNKYHPK